MPTAYAAPRLFRPSEKPAPSVCDLPVTRRAIERMGVMAPVYGEPVETATTDELLAAVRTLTEEVRSLRQERYSPFVTGQAAVHAFAALRGRT